MMSESTPKKRRRNPPKPGWTTTNLSPRGAALVDAIQERIAGSAAGLGVKRGVIVEHALELMAERICPDALQTLNTKNT